MRTQYFCKDEQRKELIKTHALLNGIDYLQVLDLEEPTAALRQRTLLVRLLKSAPTDLTISSAHVEITGGERVRSVEVEWAGKGSAASSYLPSGYTLADGDSWIVVRTDRAGDFSMYQLRLGDGDGPLDGFDPVLSEIDFSFKVECPSGFDCKAETVCPPEPTPIPPPLNYLAKDYAGFRQLMLDRLSVTLPDWRDRIPPDLGIAVVETLAYAADRLSYYQDAVANEAYLGTARKRVSVRRHARLLDYRMHEGCNARVWAQVNVDSELALERETRLLTRIAGIDGQIGGEPAYEEAVAKGAEVFETMHDAFLSPNHQQIAFYTWEDERCCLPRGATRATLFDDPEGGLKLMPGDVLVFEETRCPETGRTQDAEPEHRHAVRLTTVHPAATPDGGGRVAPTAIKDPLTQASIVQIAWSQDDALPFPLCLQVETENGLEAAAVARGNIVLADHGRRIESDEAIQAIGDPPDLCRLKESGITHAVEQTADEFASLPASGIVTQDPSQALPQVTLNDGDTDWVPRLDLLDSDRFAKEFVVEIDEEQTAWVRFGDDVHGLRPPNEAQFEVKYRVGNGSRGNVGIGAIGHIRTSDGSVLGAANPLPAVGGTQPELMTEVRLNAPCAFRTQKRAVTAEDYAAVAERHPDVQKARATRRWTGSWHTIFLTIDPKAGRPVDPAFEFELRRFIERYRLAGHDVEVEPPRFVPLDIVLTVCVEPGHRRSDVEEELLAVFSARDLPDGRRGVFHPDNLTFGEPVYLSRIISRAMEVPGVRWIDAGSGPKSVNSFRRWGERSRGEIDTGVIELGRLEIARVDNDPNRAENGRIEFIMEGGQ